MVLLTSAQRAPIAVVLLTSAQTAPTAAGQYKHDYTIDLDMDDLDESNIRCS